MTTPATKEVTFCVHCLMSGLAVDVTFTSTMDQLPNAIAKLKSLGAEAPATITAPLGSKPKPTVTYDADGSPLCGNRNCSNFGKPMVESQHNGYYCRGRDSQSGNSKGYCRCTAE